jgi:DNA repair exonuclease SbcCD ATPase subunit
MLRTFLLASAIVILLTACGLPAGTANQDVVNTAVAGTQISQALAQATVNTTALTTMPATPTPSPTVDYVTLTEEELATQIDQAVAEAVAATEQATTAVTATTTDSAVTSEEVIYVYDYYYYADYYVEYAEDLLSEYYNLYGDLANEMIVELNAIESELSQLNDTLTSIDSSLQEISSTLSQGLAVAEESIAQLESAAQQVQTNAAELQTQAQDMLSVLQADQQGRISQLSQIQANNIPTDKLSALQSAFSFVDAANAAMGDNKLTRDELLNLAQLGKNAQSGFQNFGGADRLGPDMTQFSGKFDEITTQFARGQMPQARSNIGQFETSLGSRPAGGPGGGPGPRP